MCCCLIIVQTQPAWLIIVIIKENSDLHARTCERKREIKFVTDSRVIMPFFTPVLLIDQHRR